MIDSATALFLADAILALHLIIVAFNVIPVPLIIVDGIWRWGFVRASWFRYGHLLLMAFIAIQAWLGETCPLTVWERTLRTKASDATYAGNFIGHWMQELLYVDAPQWFFVALYSGWCLLTIALFYFVPVKRKP